MILHFCSPTSWQAATDLYAAESLATAGFIHCSTKDPLTAPANLR
jgi:uncharacterized protein (DUF952 family)